MQKVVRMILGFFLLHPGSEYYSSTATDQTTSSGGSSSQGSPTYTNRHDDTGDHDNDFNTYFVPNADEWLALRVNGGSRNWKISTCFNP